MKKSIITLIAVLLSTAGIYGQKTMDKFEIQVDGLGCPFCAYGLEKKFKEFKGIKKVAIEIETGDFSFEYPAEKELTLEEVEKQVEKAGYTPISSVITRANGLVETTGQKSLEHMDLASLTTGSIFVAGNCGMCEARIVKAATGMDGVALATWDKDTKILEVKYEPNAVSTKEIEMKMAEVGHDTKNYSAKSDTYESLPACCQFERVNQ